MHSVSFCDPTSSDASAMSKKLSARKSDVELLFDAVESKREIIHILCHNKPLPRIPLPSPIVTTEQAAKDFKRERVLLNDVPFIPDQDHSSRSNGFILTLSRLIKRLQSQGACISPGVADVASCILQRACRTTTGADSFFMVQNLFCIDGTFIVQKTDKHDPPVKVDVFVIYDKDRDDNDDNNEDSDSLRSSQNSVVSRTSNRHRNDSNGNCGAKHRSGSGSGDRHVSRTSSMSSKHSTRSDSIGGGGNGSSNDHHSHPYFFSSSSSFSFSNTIFATSSSGSNSSGNNISITNNPSASAVIANANCSVSATSALLEDNRLRQIQQQSAAISSSSNNNNQNFVLVSSSSSSWTLQHHLCARIESMNVFTLYDTDQMENMTGDSGSSGHGDLSSSTNQQQDPLPWLELEATVMDEMDFSTGEAWRSLLIECTYPPLTSSLSTRPSVDNTTSSSIYTASASSVMAMTSWLTGSSHGSGSNSVKGNNHNHNNKNSGGEGRSILARQISPPATLLRTTPPLTTAQQQQQMLHPQYPTRSNNSNKPPFSSSSSSHSHSSSPSLPSTAAVSASSGGSGSHNTSRLGCVRSTSDSGSDYSLSFLSGRDRSHSGSQAEQLPQLQHSSSSRSRGNSNSSGNNNNVNHESH